jgi:hypothetical protein
MVWSRWSALGRHIRAGACPEGLKLRYHGSCGGCGHKIRRLGAKRAWTGQGIHYCRAGSDAGAPPLNFNARNETTRGYLLVLVFFIHGLYDYTYSINSWTDAPIAFAFIKFLAPQVSLYFFLSGMSVRAIGKKSFRAVLPQSLMLIFLAWVSEGLGIIPDELLYNNDGTGLTFIKALVKPMIYGTGGCTYVTWFFTVLAVGRILVWIFEKSKIYFALSWLVIVGMILAAKHLHLPDNLYEWRNWPIATLFMVIGMKFPKDWRVPPAIGLSAFVAGLALTWFNVPGIWHAAPCLTCHVDFVSQPMVGSYGSLPVFILEQLCLFLALLCWAQAPPAISIKIGRYFGRSSLKFLLLHGWLIVTVMPIIGFFLPHKGNLLILVAIFVLNPWVHVGFFYLTESYLNRVVAFCFKSGRAVADWIFAVTSMKIGLRRPLSDGLDGNA